MNLLAIFISQKNCQDLIAMSNRKNDQPKISLADPNQLIANKRK